MSSFIDVEYDALDRDICMATIALRGHRDPPSPTIIPIKKTLQRLASLRHIAALINTGSMDDFVTALAAIPKSEDLHALVVALRSDRTPTTITVHPLTSSLSGSQVLEQIRDGPYVSSVSL